MTTDTDRIQKRIVLRAPLERVWAAVSDASRFGSWFGVAFDGAFVPGKPLRGKIVPTKADPEVAKSQEAYAGAAFEITVHRVEPMTLFSFKWHPFAVDPKVDYSAEPMTVVTFELEKLPEGTQLTITETGFDRVPLARRAKAFQMNDQGWSDQLLLVQKYLALAS
ncbi:MAG TPA: SRPBCC family protein [Polyangiaceae bacterium]|jgi:uncharacterized protein YndB with AHSA1/START domain